MAHPLKPYSTYVGWGLYAGERLLPAIVLPNKEGDLMKHAFKLMLAVAVVVFCASLTARSEVEHAIYLKDGTVVKGKILEVAPGETVRIRTSDGQVQTYDVKDVDKIMKRKARSGSSSSSSSSSSRFELSLLGGYGSHDIYKVGLGARIGYVFSNGFYAGLSGAYHLGTTESAQLIGYTLSATANSIYVGPELGYDVRLGFGTSLRPYVNGGYYGAHATVSGFGTSGTNSESRFYVAPGLLLQFAAGPFLIGADGRYLIVTGENGEEVNSFGVFGSLGFGL
jgi:hypothetical protein